MEGSFEKQLEDKIMRKVGERLSDEANGFNEKINYLKARFVGYVITTGLVASLIGGSVGYALNSRTEKELKGLNDTINAIHLDQIKSFYLNDSEKAESSHGPVPIKLWELEERLSSKQLEPYPMPVPGSTRQLESSLDEY